MARTSSAILLATLILALGPWPAQAAEVTSTYVTMRDGTRLAVDVWLPARPTDTRIPAILQLTRYWRALRKTGRPPLPDAGNAIEFFTGCGYAVVVVDVRGTGASFGRRETEFSDAEVEDAGEIIDWIGRQPWSNGRVATLGSSYLGNAAELAAIPARPALRAIVPRFTDFSEYRHAVRPGGTRNTAIADAWIDFTRALDRNDGCAAFEGTAECPADAPWSEGVKPVDEDPDGELLAAALRDHERSTDLRAIVSKLVYSDDPFGEQRGTTLETVSPSARWRAIDRARVPAHHWASWFDGGTAAGVLERVGKYGSPLKIIIGPWTHGGGQDTNPYREDPFAAYQPLTPTEQLQMVVDFLDPHLRGPGQPERPTEIRYFTLGTNAWRITHSWPPLGIVSRRWYLHDAGRLEPRSDLPLKGADAYKVDLEATTGMQNRWRTQLGATVDYDSSADADSRRLTYTSEPLPEDLEITGTPIADLWISTSASDGAVFVYLKDVMPDGRVIYLTEGQRRLLFPLAADAQADQDEGEALAEFASAAANPPVPGELRRYRIEFHPISVVLARGHRLRLAVAGADADTFERLPATGPAPRLTVARNRSNASHLVLPVRQ